MRLSASSLATSVEVEGMAFVKLFTECLNEEFPASRRRFEHSHRSCGPEHRFCRLCVGLLRGICDSTSSEVSSNFEAECKDYHLELTNLTGASTSLSAAHHVIIPLALVGRQSRLRSRER